MMTTLVGLLWIGAGGADAGFATAYGNIIGETPAGTGSVVNFQLGPQQVQGDTFASVNLSTGAPYFSFASAVAQSDPHKLVQALAGANAGDVPIVGASAEAIWGADTLTISNPSGGQLPGSVILHFTVEGAIPSTPGQNGWELNLGARQAITPTPVTSFDPGSETGRIESGGNKVSYFGSFDSVSIQGGTFEVSYHASLTLGPTSSNSVSAYWWDAMFVGYEAVSNTGGQGIAFDPLTVDFASLTLPDGNTPESEGFAVSFASGLASPDVVNSAPEPASLTLLGIGGTCWLCYGRRQRKRAVA
jgi:hypothetical protein